MKLRTFANVTLPNPSRAQFSAAFFSFHRDDLPGDRVNASVFLDLATETFTVECVIRRALRPAEMGFRLDGIENMDAARIIGVTHGRELAVGLKKV